MGAILTQETSLLGCVGPGAKVVAPVGPVVEQAQYDLGGPRLVGRAANYNIKSSVLLDTGPFPVDPPLLRTSIARALLLEIRPYYVLA